MKPLLGVALIGATWLAPALAVADTPWYGALDIGTLTMGRSSYPDPGSLTVSGGYRFSRHVAAEAGLTGYGDSTVVDGSGSSTARQGDLRFLAVGYLPLSPQFEIFGKAGLGLHSVKMLGTGSYPSTASPNTTMNVILGVGAQVNFNTRFAMRLQFESLGKAKSGTADPGADISRVTVGGVLNF